MKTYSTITLLTLLASTMLFAQSEPTVKPETPTKQQQVVNSDIQNKIKVAREKALQEPELQPLKEKADAINEEFRKALQTVMIKINPELADIINISPEKKQQMAAPFANISEGDRKKLQEAIQKANSDPEVLAILANRKEASTPEEQKEAAKEFHQAMQKAIIKADPTLVPVLEQIKKP